MPTTSPSRGLSGALRFWEAIAISSGIAIALISYSFVRLTRYFNHAGSTYALAGVTLGPRAGFFGGYPYDPL